MVALADHKLTPTLSPSFELNLPDKANIVDCEAAYMSIRDCYRETTRAYTTGQARIFMGPDCCRAAQDFKSGCWPKIFGPDPFYPRILEIYCSRSLVLFLSLFATLLALSPSGLAQEQTVGVELESTAPSQPTLGDCWQSIEEIIGCYSEIYRAFVNGKLGITIGPSCCLAIEDIASNCWPQMFPDAPSFPSLLKGYCRRFQGGQPDALTPSAEPDDF
ncbi:hypothetical protein L2E82_12002 [Cichorium intybus]|uniref:Uncharacterized protein n=1 Tax=Cichorium intybus TaxID=13427 RepID=A0ACB9GEC2_CICIN|nr:hypothetical protein L2E82_12002 [Cichorium intybus]